MPLKSTGMNITGTLDDIEAVLSNFSNKDLPLHFTGNDFSLSGERYYVIVMEVFNLKE